jgi:hypothetical protein
MATGDYVWQFGEEFRIVEGRLMHRLQSVYISRKCLVTTPTSFIHNPPSG